MPTLNQEIEERFAPSNSRLREKARKLGVGTREFLRFAKLRGCDRSRVSP